MTTYGILGVGSIASAIVTGLGGIGAAVRRGLDRILARIHA